MKTLLKIYLTALVALSISACGAENLLSKSQAISFLETQGYTEINILSEANVESECTKSFHEKGYNFQANFSWIFARTHHVEGVVCGGAYEDEIIWSSSAGEVATDLPEDELLELNNSQ